MVEKNSNKTKGFRQKTHESFDKVMDDAESITQSGKETVTNMIENGKIMRQNIGGHIQKNPGKSVLIATGVGIIAGAILTATLMRRKAKVIHWYNLIPRNTDNKS